MNTLLAGYAAALVAFFVGGSVQAAAPAEMQVAVWTPKELNFTYHGFTTKYSCEGLRDRVKDILLELGARKDLKVYTSGCTGAAGTPDAFPGVRARMNVLQPATDSFTGELVEAHWQLVELKGDQSAVSRVGDCELIEQVQKQILPLFPVRNVELTSNCIPHQSSPGVTRLKTEVLKADSQSKGS